MKRSYPKNVVENCRIIETRSFFRAAISKFESRTDVTGYDGIGGLHPVWRFLILNSKNVLAIRTANVGDRLPRAGPFRPSDYRKFFELATFDQLRSRERAEKIAL